MSDTSKPRHIRDIAHIYLSRLQTGRPAFHDRLIVCAESRAAVPAFHAANLAAAFSLKGADAASPLDVTLFDVSGLLPNVGYYLALPARAYLAPRDGLAGAGVSAFMDIRLKFSFDPTEPGGYDTPAPKLDIFHIPPFEHRDVFERALSRLRTGQGMNTVFLFLHLRDETLPDVRESVCSRLGDAQFYTLGLEMRNHRFDPDKLGTITAWESNVADRVPIVCRDSRSTLARRYDSICDGLIYKIRVSRRRRSAAGIARRSARLDAV